MVLEKDWQIFKKTNAKNNTKNRPAGTPTNAASYHPIGASEAERSNFSSFAASPTQLRLLSRCLALTERVLILL
jgi:hypothetical protein